MKTSRFIMYTVVLGLVGGGLVVSGCSSSSNGATCGSGTTLVNGQCEVEGDGGSRDGATADANTDAAPDAPTRDCPVGKGPTMAPIPAPGGGAFCIDTTEVTVAQYAAFVAAKNGDASGQPSDCSWNMSFGPDSSGQRGCTAAVNDVQAHGSDPVRCVDWCDAFAFCSWAGKRLCGLIGGGSLPDTGADSEDPRKSQLAAAITSGGKYDHTYGNGYSGGVCADPNYTSQGLKAPIQVGTATRCHSPDPTYAAVFDLNGNVQEWIDGCPSGSTFAECSNLGGAFDGETHLPLSFGSSPRATALTDLGFRCCVD